MNLDGLKIGWELAKKRRKESNNLICPVCGKLFNRRGTRKTRTKKPTCSIKCKAISQRGISHFKPRHGIVIKCKTCGKEVYKYPRQKKIYCSIACRTKDPESYKHAIGENHYNWKGGVSPKNQIERRLPSVRKWKRDVFKRDGFMCRLCGEGYYSTGKRVRLHAHHIHPWSTNPEKRTDINNGITVCVKCHGIIHNKKFK